MEQEIPQADVAVMSGASHAEEVGRGLPTTVVAGAHTKQSAEQVQTFFMNEVFSCLYKSGHAGDRVGGFPEKCYCAGSRNGRRTWLW